DQGDGVLHGKGGRGPAPGSPGFGGGLVARRRVAGRGLRGADGLAHRGRGLGSVRRVEDEHGRGGVEGGV
ncbi:MAG: hypothetical protein AVDCRST_MAG73-3650, partial [uncultured Thermomicrobiales bacterium]